MDKGELAKYVERLQAGDINVFEVIYNETNSQVYNLLYSYTKNEETSFDLMQETYLTVNSKIRNLKEPCYVRTWINRIAINKANKFFAKNNKEILVSEDGQDLFEAQLEEDEEFLPQEILDSKEKQNIIKSIIDNLPIEQKTTVYLYYFDELSLGEVADDMECSEGTVKSRLNYARKKIKKEVDTWEEKGTKLYGTGVSVLLLLLRNQLEIENISLDKANILLKRMINSISGGSVINNVHEIVDNKNKLSNTINFATKSTKRVLGIKLAVAGGILIVVIAGILFNRPTPVVEPSESAPVIKSNIYISYSTLCMENGISSLDISGDDIVVVNNLTNDQCIEILKKDSANDGKGNVKVKGSNGNEMTIDVEVRDNKVHTINRGSDNASNNESDYLFRPYKNFTDGTISSVSDYDQNIVQIINEPEKKHFKIKALKEGSTTAKIIDDKGLIGELKLGAKADEGNNYYISDDTSKECK